MAPYYRIVTSSGALPSDASILESMEKANEEELKKFAERLEEAEKTEGESDIADALRAKASYLTRIGDKVRKPIVPVRVGSERMRYCRRRLSKLRKLLWRRHRGLDRG